MSILSASSVDAVSINELSQNIIPIAKSANQEERLIEQKIRSGDSGKFSAKADCDADFCTNLGQQLSLNFICTVDIPAATCRNVFGPLPPGASIQGSTTGNPGIATFVWPNPGPPGKYSFTTQAISVFCPPEQTCTPSPLNTVTIKIFGPNSENPEDRLPDPSNCAVTTSPECLSAQTRCVQLLGEARLEECQDRYPFGSQFEVEIPAIISPKNCEDSFSSDCASAQKQCIILGGSEEFCEKTYPFASEIDDFLKTHPPGACDDDGLFTATCDQFRRECQLYGFPDNFCETNYPFPTSEESILVRVDPSGHACDDPTSDACHRALAKCKVIANDDAFCQRSFPAR